MMSSIVIVNAISERPFIFSMNFLQNDVKVNEPVYIA